MKKVITLVLLLCMISGGVVLSSLLYLGRPENIFNVAEGPNWPPDDETTLVIEYF